MRKIDLVNIFIQRLPFKLKRLANEKKLDTNPNLEERVISFEILENYINRKHIAIEMTPELLDDVNYIESTHRYQHPSRPQFCHQHYPDNKPSPHFYKFCKFCHSISRCFKRQTDHY